MAQSWRREERWHALNSWWLIALVVGVLVVGCGWLVFRTTDSVAHVTSVWWQRTINIEVIKPVRESGWSLPGDAYAVERSTRQRGTREIPDGYDTVSEQVAVTTSYDCSTSSSGRCSRVEYETHSDQKPRYRSEPVFETWYEYTVDRWRVVRTWQAGRHDKSPYWPEPDGMPSGARAVQMPEVYEITFTTDKEGAEHKFRMDHAAWVAVCEHGEYALATNAFGKALSWKYASGCDQNKW